MRYQNVYSSCNEHHQPGRQDKLIWRQDKLIRQYVKLIRRQDKLIRRQVKLIRRQDKLIWRQDKLIRRQVKLIRRQVKLIRRQDKLIRRQDQLIFGAGAIGQIDFSHPGLRNAYRVDLCYTCTRSLIYFNFDRCKSLYSIVQLYM